MENIRLDHDEVYASVSANCQENSISCEGQYLLYSRCNCPVIYSLKQNKVVSLLLGHSDKVNNQHFVDTSLFHPEGAENIYVISTSQDKTAIIWNFDPKQLKSEILHQFTAPNESSFTSSCSFRDRDGNFVSITTSIDCSICLWVNGDLSYMLETRYCCFMAKLFSLRINEFEYKFLFLAGSDNKIRVFQVNTGYLDFLFELLGHSDWIKCIDAVSLGNQGFEFLLASSSQDSYVRVWHMKLVDCDLDLSQHIRTVTSKPLQVSYDQKYRLTATLETVLSGHEGIVYGLCWFKKMQLPALRLISCSADKTIIMWKSFIASPDSQSKEQNSISKYDQNPASVGVWQQVDRFGETGETNLPFLGVCLSDDEKTFYAISLRGAIHSWSLEDQDESKTVTESWSAQPAILGHFGPITDMSWESSGAYLLSVSLDKTCRLHALSSLDDRWHELARPQVHGYEINCVTSLSEVSFATGAEEQNIRVFRSTQFFLRNFQSLTSTSLLRNHRDDFMDCLPVHARLPALGLSNKAANSPYGDVELAASQDSGASSNWYSVSKLSEHLAEINHLESLPIEEILLQSTLWEEVHKFHAHGNELHALASNSTGSFFASASRANRADLANIIIWDGATFRKNTIIVHHSLTVTRLRFSPNDRYLLSVSRDRTWCLSKATDKMRPHYEKAVGTTKDNAVHERIIWDCCWTNDSRCFITVSRDKKALLWSADIVQSEGGIDRGPTRTELFDCSIQAVDACPGTTEAGNLVAFGLEDGTLALHLLLFEGSSSAGMQDRDDDNPPKLIDWQRIKSIPNFHHLPIRRLAFRPDSRANVPDYRRSERDETSACSDETAAAPSLSRSAYNHKRLLASGSDDCIVKLVEFTMSPT